jgi:hypothetical protein
MYVGIYLLSCWQLDTTGLIAGISTLKRMRDGGTHRIKDI